MNFCCVTPCYNAERHIRHTMESVLSQSVLKDQSNQLYYIIKDGGSTDTTIDIIKEVAFKYSNFPNVTLEILSQKDEGMYDALAASFQKLPHGDIYSYINAGDYYSLFAFEIIAEIFTMCGVQFLTGLNCIYNEKNHLLSCVLPYKYNRELLLAGYYGTILPHVQQESTFWGRVLHNSINFEKLRGSKLAGDYLLWKTFIDFEPLYIVSAHLGGFKIHKGQLTDGAQIEYENEVKEIAGSGSVWMFAKALFYKLCWLLPNMLKKRLSKQIFEYDHSNMQYTIPMKKYWFF